MEGVEMAVKVFCQRFKHYWQFQLPLARVHSNCCLGKCLFYCSSLYCSFALGMTVSNSPDSCSLLHFGSGWRLYFVQSFPVAPPWGWHEFIILKKHSTVQISVRFNASPSELKHVKQLFSTSPCFGHQTFSERKKKRFEEVYSRRVVQHLVLNHFLCTMIISCRCTGTNTYNEFWANTAIGGGLIREGMEKSFRDSSPQNTKTPKYTSQPYHRTLSLALSAVVWGGGIKSRTPSTSSILERRQTSLISDQWNSKINETAVIEVVPTWWPCRLCCTLPLTHKFTLIPCSFLS